MSLRPPLDYRATGVFKTLRDRVCPKCQQTLRLIAGAFGTHVKFCGEQERIFWSRVDKLETGCWVHRGCRDKWGYAHHGISGKRHQAHRLAWQFKHGAIPVGKLLMHSCDNPPCVNPAHLSLGTDQENMDDKLAKKGRYIQATKRKLSDDQVRAIRREYRATNKRKTNAKELAAKYGVVANTIAGIVARRTWEDIE